ncbi:bifunctional precorrin-2 dehydrogenase/sirohydrochlorin ferrochelatase [Candidatus Acidulodesulfobacterium sp. H_13]|uniref:precorrin-2 dehydrogenase/sirohydrochlorin ferrochelatase family protein n=1 Tax=Candidatus Acidulodesulfobacterium sp. H_13 TaxID=3395470 RepID=UPI003AF8136E
MKCYPVNLNIYNKKVLVVGGGVIAARKTERLLERGANVTLVAPEITEKINGFIKKSRIKWVQREYKAGDESGAFAVFCAVSSEEKNLKMEESLSKRCVRKNILINVADKPELCTFTLPALVSRGEFDIAIFTGGLSPRLSRKIREDLEKIYGEEYTTYVKILGLMRREIKMKKYPQSRNQKLFDELVNSDLFELVKDKKFSDISIFISSFLKRS